MHNQSGIPQVLEVNSSGIPQELKALLRWVVWKLNFTGKKREKIPIDTKTGRFASSTNPSTWCTFEQARKYFQCHRGAGIMGIGFVFTKDDPYTGVDLDHCRDAETGDILPWALEIVQYLNSYTELSPSGTGLHIIVFGVLPPGLRKVGDVEMYDDVHYFTITGNLLPSVGQAIENRQEELKVLHARFLGGGRHDASTPIQPDFSGRQGKASLGAGGWEPLLQKLRSAELTPADQDIIRQFKTAQYGEMYRLLFMGDWEGAGRLRKQGPYKSHSDADQALANRLARVTDGNPTRMYAIFKESKLAMREKIKDHQTYLARTIKKAIDGMGWQPPITPTGGRGRR
jgi:putative DNA primase/helicase